MDSAIFRVKLEFCTGKQDINDVDNREVELVRVVDSMNSGSAANLDIVRQLIQQYLLYKHTSVITIGNEEDILSSCQG